MNDFFAYVSIALVAFAATGAGIMIVEIIERVKSRQKIYKYFYVGMVNTDTGISVYNGVFTTVKKIKELSDVNRIIETTEIDGFIIVNLVLIDEGVIYNA